ncbi:hypothetical protein BJX99DRAFT_254210 [Aspergillus californicus]
MPPGEIIDEEGDIIVDCAGILFRVSFKALALASPIFYYKFQPASREGKAVPGQAHTNVRLPDDDSDAFRIFCNIAHHNSTRLPLDPDPDTLQRLAVFVNKYQGHDAVVRHGYIWLQQSTQGRSAEDLWRLFQFAHSLNLHTSCFELSREIILQRGLSSRFRDWDFATKNLALMHEDVLDKLDARLASLRSKVEVAIVALVEKAPVCECQPTAAYVGKYIGGLKRHGIFPGTPAIGEKSFSEICDVAANSFPIFLWDSAVNMVREASCDGCNAFGKANPEQKSALVLELLQLHPRSSVSTHTFSSAIPTINLGSLNHNTSLFPNRCSSRFAGHELFLVSSKIISVASPVFKVMLKPEFKEGSVIDDQGCHVVNLPEDDPDTFLVFCQIAYHRLEDLAEKVKPEFLSRLAAYKYLCHAALLDRAQIWLEQWYKGRPLEDFWSILQFAYVFGQKKHFASITRELLLGKPIYSRDWTFGDHNSGLIPELVIGWWNFLFPIL